MAVKSKRNLEKVAVAALEDIKAQDIVVLDVHKLTSLYDTLVIASAASVRQTKALAQHVRDKLKEAGAMIIGVEGEEGGEWVLVDAGDIVVHVMQPAIRHYYDLEELWSPPLLSRAPARKTAAAPVKAAVGRKTAAKTPGTKKPGTKKPVAKKTSVKKPAARKTAVKKTARKAATE